MRQQMHFISGPTRATIGALTLAILFAFGAPQAALANTAANSILRNTVYVDYNDAGGTPQAQIFDSVDITVTLVAASPTLSAPIVQTTDSATNAVYNYTITANTNGPDTYDLSVDSIVNSAGINGSTAVLSSASVSLGASTVAVAGSIAAGGTTDITVPSDGAGGGGVNSIIFGDTVVINGQVFTVAAVTDNGGVPGVSTIRLNGNGTATAIAVGDVIGEQTTFTLTVTPGAVSATTDQTIDVTIGAQDSGTIDAKVTDVTQTTVQVAALSVIKEVSTDGGTTFAANANAAPSPP